MSGLKYADYIIQSTGMLAKICRVQSTCLQENEINIYQGTEHRVQSIGLWAEMNLLQHGLSIGVTNRSDSKSPFFRAEFYPNGHKNCENKYLKIKP